MQILYIANDQSDKQAVVNSLRSIGPDVAIACTSRLDEAPRWIDDNPDVAALVVDIRAETQLTVQFLKHVRRSGLNAPVIVLTHDQAGLPIDTLKAGADDYIVKDQALFDELPRVVGSRIARVQTQVGTGTTKRLRILYAGDAALARTCGERTPYSIQVTEAVADPNETPQPLPSELRAAAVPLPFDVILVEHGYRGLDIFAILKELASRELSIPVILVVEWDDDLALPAIKMGAADFVIRAHEPLGALFFRLGRDHFDRGRTRLGELRAPDEQSERSGEDEADDRSEQERARIREFEQRLEAAETAFKDAEQWHASDIAKCTARFGDERAQLESRLVELAAARDELAEKLNLAETVAERAERLRSWEVLNRAELSERTAELKTQLAHAVRGREAVKQQLCHAEDVAEAARRAYAAAAEAVEQLTRRETDLQALLASAKEDRDAFDRRLTSAEAAMKEAGERATDDRTAAKERQAELETRLDSEVQRRNALERQLAETEAAHNSAEQRYESALATANVQRAEREAKYEISLTRAAAAWEMVNEQLSEAGLAVDRARESQAATAAALERVTCREAELSARLAEAIASHDELTVRLTAAATLEQLTRRDAQMTSQLARATSMFDAVSVRLAAAEAGQRDAVERARQGEGAATEQQARLQARLDEETETRQRLEGRLADEETARKIADEARETLSQQLCVVQAVADEARQQEQVTTAALERMTRREAELTLEVVEATAAHQGLTVRLAKAEAARRDADARARHEQASATERHAALEARLEQATATHRRLESKLADEESARMAAEEAHATLAERLRLAETAAEHAQQEQQSAAASLEEMKNREADLTARLTEAAAARDRVTVRLADEETARKAVGEQHAAAMKTAAAQLAAQSTQFESALSHAAEAQEALSQRLKAAEAAVEAARRQQLAASAALEHMTRREAKRSAQLAEAAAAHEGLTARLADMEAARRAADERTRTEQAAATERQSQLEVRLKQAAEAQERRDQQLNVATSDRDVLTVRLSDAEAAGKEAHDEIVKVRSVAEGAQRGLELERDSLQKALDAIGAQLQREKNERADVQDRLDQLQNVSEIQLGASAKRFDQAPLAVVRCTRDGVPTQANRAFGVLTGYQADDLIAESAPQAFEMSDELSGLIQRCLQTGAVETIETRWKRKDGGHLHVRVSAFATTQGVDIAAEDISSLRSLQARLDRAQRMEAVGRLASEVAVTCGNLLRDVSEDGQRWLATLGSDAAVRERATALLRDVTRAASFLGQLTADGDEQADRREPVDLPRLLRDMEPVLKRVAGEHIKLVLPKTIPRGSPPIHVDLMADRVERLLVNVASYGRERMPFGGRLIFDLTTVDVDQQFVARYPNVRRGPHALITITEVGDPSRTGGTLALRDVLAEARAGTSVLEKPGLDLGTLQAIVRECGGHLWMEIQPPGQMVAKIHLPLRVGDEPVHSIAVTQQTRLGRSLGRLFHH